jgi:hypothetical protein
MWRIGSISLLASAVLFICGCESTPREPVMRPIPPPPPGPPPGAAIVVYGPATNIVASAPGVSTNVISAPNPAEAGRYEVSSNYVATAQTNAAMGASVQGGQGMPQYEIIPPRPGPDYVWRDGYWSWQGTWVWIPGQWMYRPPPVIFMPEPGFSYHYHFGGPWRYGYRRHHRWR